MTCVRGEGRVRCSERLHSGAGAPALYMPCLEPQVTAVLRTVASIARGNQEAEFPYRLPTSPHQNRTDPTSGSADQIAALCRMDSGGEILGRHAELRPVISPKPYSAAGDSVRLSTPRKAPHLLCQFGFQGAFPSKSRADRVEVIDSLYCQQGEGPEIGSRRGWGTGNKYARENQEPAVKGRLAFLFRR